MKTFIITLGLLLTATTALAERQGGPQDGDRDGHRARMQQELGLSEQQIQQMREIREQGGSREDMRAVMTEEQQTRAQEMRKSRQGDHAQRMNRMKEQLELSDEQVTQMQQIREQGGSREDMHAVLTEQQQAKLAEKRGAHQGKKRKPE
ncbi:MAG: hypothetical protein OEV47_09350 [Gammaproteobacteria bacterium]|nr:hypothetical protein [Gammaproteobacteria bacterium]